jgi:hypothetical protein
MPMAEDPAPGLPGLPGASSTAGSGPVVPPLLAGLLDDAAALPPHADVAGVLSAHRKHLAGHDRELLGPLLVPARAVEEVRSRLEPRDHALRIVLVGTAPEPLPELREAVAALAGEDRVEVAGVVAPLPAGEAGSAARETLEALTFSVPAWIDVSGTPQWQAALDILAADGAENAAFRAAGPQPGQIADDDDLARFLRDAVDRDLQFTMTGGLCHAVRGRDPDTAAEHHGVLNLLCAVRAALNGAEVPEVREVIAEQRPEPLASAARRMSDADAAVVRAFLGSVACGSVSTAVDELSALGLYLPQ